MQNLQGFLTVDGDAGQLGNALRQRLQDGIVIALGPSHFRNPFTVGHLLPGLLVGHRRRAQQRLPDGDEVLAVFRREQIRPGAEPDTIDL